MLLCLCYDFMHTNFIKRTYENIGILVILYFCTIDSHDKAIGTRLVLKENICHNEEFIYIFKLHAGGSGVRLYDGHHFSQGARNLKIRFAQLIRQKKFDCIGDKKYLSTTFLGKLYSQIVVAIFQEHAFCTLTLF